LNLYQWMLTLPAEFRICGLQLQVIQLISLPLQFILRVFQQLLWLTIFFHLTQLDGLPNLFLFHSRLLQVLCGFQLWKKCGQRSMVTMRTLLQETQLSFMTGYLELQLNSTFSLILQFIMMEPMLLSPLLLHNSGV
jgi:hypothetical protein